MAKITNLNPLGDQGGTFGFGGASNIGGGFNSLAGAVSDLTASFGDQAEAENYRLAAGLADKNAQYTELSTAIKNTQTDREIFQTIGMQKAQVAGAGFAEGGSAGDLLRSSVSQGALQHAVISQQGLMQEEAYKEQAQSYRNMADAADKASTFSDIGAGLKIASSIAMFVGL